MLLVLSEPTVTEVISRIPYLHLMKILSYALENLLSSYSRRCLVLLLPCTSFFCLSSCSYMNSQVSSCAALTHTSIFLLFFCELDAFLGFHKKSFFQNPRQKSTNQCSYVCTRFLKLHLFLRPLRSIVSCEPMQFTSILIKVTNPG